MNDTIKLWLDYFGGVNIAYIAAATTAMVQLIKPFVPKGRWRGHMVRTLAAVLGTAFGIILIGHSSRGAMVGLSVGSSASFAWFIAACRLEAGNWQDAGKMIAARMKGG